MGNKKIYAGMFLASVFGASLALGGFLIFGNPKKVYQTVSNNQPVQFSKLSTNVPAGLNFVESASTALPAVVHVKTYKEVTYAQQQQQYVDPFEYFFRDFFGENYRRPQQPQQPQPKSNGKPEEQPMGFGSGVIISADGYIVTNNHVVDGADKVEVTLDDNRTFEATVIGTDPTTDLALLKVDEKELPFLNFGVSDDIQIGEWVLAVGNPFNLTSTVTAGIVSAKARNINIIRDKNNMGIESFIQTDAAVNPGNSGGALVNLNGELIGINTAIQSETGSFAGYAFAIPSAIAEKVVMDLKNYGMVQRGMLGIEIRPLTTEIAAENDIKVLKGVFVNNVTKNSSAADAGIEKNDVIIKINGVIVNSPSELQEQVARYRPGDKLKVSFVRGQKEKEVEVVLKNSDGSTQLLSKEEAEFSNSLGASFEKPEKDLMKQLNLKNGVAVKNIRSGKFKTAGIRDNFIILKVDKTEVNSEDDIKKILKDKKGGVLVEGIYPNGNRAYYAFEW